MFRCHHPFTAWGASRCAALMRSLCLVFLVVVLPSAEAKESAEEVSSNPDDSTVRESGALETFEEVWKLIQPLQSDASSGEVDWDALRAEFRPRIKASESEDETRQLVQEMLDRLGRSHMYVIPGDTLKSLPGASDSAVPGSDDYPGDVGLEIRWTQGRALVFRLVPGGSAQRAGVAWGWEIKKIDGLSVASMVSELPDRMGKSYHELQASLMVASLCEGPEGARIEIEFLNHRDQPVTLELQCQRPTGQAAQIGWLPTYYSSLEARSFRPQKDVSVGLIRFNLWMVPILAQFDEAIDGLRDSDGIVLDLRGNTGGLVILIMRFAGHFMGKRMPLGTLTMQDTQLQFFSFPQRINPHGKRVEPFSGPLAILVDSVTASASELFAASMQVQGRARVFGEQTPGAALPSMFDRLPNGDVLVHAIGDFILADGSRVEGKGVIPDESIPLRRADLIAGRDQVMQAALLWIQQQHSANN